MLGATLLGAACDDTQVVQPPPPPVTISLLPETATLTVGQTLALTVVVTNSTNQAATFVSSNPAAATVNPSTGVVTAVAAGITVITATAAADANAKDASTITVNAVVPPATPSISIKSVTTGNLLTPVNPNNVFGQIDVTLNVTVPAGAAVQRVETLLDGNVVCSQAFTSSGSITVDQDEIDSADEIVCPIVTSAFNATTGVPTFPNGSHALSARLVQPNGNVISTPSTTLIFNNTNFITATFTGQRSANSAAGPRSVQPVGSQWLGGDITATFLSVNYSGSTNNLASLTLNMTTSGLGVTGVGGCVVPVTSSLSNSLIDPTISSTDGGAGAANLPSCAAATVSRTVTAAQGATFTAVLPANANMGNGGVQNVEDFFPTAGIVINSITSGGQAGPVCINPNPTTNPQGLGCTGGAAAFANPIRVDNLAPRVTQLNIVRPNQYFNAAFVPNHSAAGGTTACTAPCARTVDYGVDAQSAGTNTKFFAGPAAGPLVDVTANFGPLPESPVSTTNVFNLQTTDALQNTRSVFATATATTVSTSATSASDLLFGIDNTAPTQAVTGPPNNSTNCPVAPSNPASCAGQNSWLVAFSDAGVGPSGFNVNPVTVKAERILAAGTTCFNDAGVAISCTTNGGVYADDGNVQAMAASATDGYWRITTFVTDAANNVSTTSVIVTLRDYVAPVAGGISSPASIAGGAQVVFSSALQDNVELGDVMGATTFGAAVMTLADARQSIGTYGPDAIVNTSTGTFTIASFIRSIEQTSATGLPNNTIDTPNVFEYVARDVAGVQINNSVVDGCPAAGAADGTTTQNCILRNVNIAAAVALGTSTQTPTNAAAWDAFNTNNGANALQGLFVHAAPSNATVCTKANAVACAPAQPFSTVLTATVTGPAGTFANPFARLVFYFQDAGGRWQPIPGTVSVTATDNTVTSTRTFTFTLTWTPTGLPTFVANVRAIGVNSTGNALVSQPQVVNLTAT
jgi:hypothetical protein